VSHGLLGASWVLQTGDELANRIREHWSNTQLGSGAGVLGVLLLVSLLKKLIFIAVVLLVLVGLGVAYQAGAFDSALDNIRG
jgi:hypothetical protein